MNSFDQSLAETAVSSAKRALNLLDRSPFSKTYGCFDRYFWHFKMKDFSSASYQMGSEFLARLWSFESSANPYFSNPDILEWCKASMLYTLSIQHDDGSFDEWYPNERGWAGPTSYVCHALYASYKIIEPHVDDPEFKQKVLDGFLKAGHFLIKRDEKEVLSNHFALYLLSLTEIVDLTQDARLSQALDQGVQKFFEYVSHEGWSLEYDGIDFGYNVATLSFFARMDQLRPDQNIREYVERSLDFLSFFIFPNGEVGAGMGSRATVHLYPFGFSYWAQYFPMAQSIHDHLIAKNQYFKTAPADQDDHYLFYRLSEYLEAAEGRFVGDDSAETLPELPYKKGNILQGFPDAGFTVLQKNGAHCVVNSKMGGMVTVSPGENSHPMIKNYGWVIVSSHGKVYSSLWHGDYIVETKPGTISVRGSARQIFSDQFSPLKLVVFRTLTGLFARFALGAYFVKLLIRKILIVGKGTSPYRFSRLIEFSENRVVVTDEIQGLQKGDRLFWGGDFTVRYVPQSRYFHGATSPLELLSIPDSGPMRVSETINLETGESVRCVP